MPHLEDEALYQALLRTDTPVRKSPHVRVITSTRLQGRVDVGFSEQLRYWNALNQANRYQLVEAAGSIIQRLQNQHHLRTLWQNRLSMEAEPEIQRVANGLMIDADWLHQQLHQAAFFGQLWESVEREMRAGQWAKHWQPVPIETAIGDLRLFLRTVTLVQR